MKQLDLLMQVTANLHAALGREEALEAAITALTQQVAALRDEAVALREAAGASE